MQAPVVLNESSQSFPVINGVPRFVESESYSKNFGEQWRLFRQTQLDSYSGLPLSQERLKRCLGDSLWAQLEGKKVLECGCGAGRFTEILLQQKAQVVSIDLSHAIEVNAQNFPLSSHHWVAQADILALPFAPRQFDVVLCMGVLQHTPDPEETLRHLYQQLKPGGYLIVDQYIFNRSYWSLRLLYRQGLKRLAPKTSFRLIQALGDLFLPLHKAVRHSRVLSLILNRVSPMVTYYRAYPQLNDRLQREWALLDTFDTSTDWYKNFGTLKKLSSSLKKAGFETSESWLGGNGIEARAQRF